MNKLVTVGVGIAALVVGFVVGWRVFGPPSVDGSGPEAARTPQPSVAEPATRAGGDEERPFVLWTGETGGPRITVTIAAPGWYGDPGGGILVKNDDADPPDGAGMIGPFPGELYVPADPCRWSTTTPDTPASTVDGLVAALENQASRDASAPVDITVDGYAGKAIILNVPEDADFFECDQGEFCTLLEDDVTECARYHQGAGQIDEVWILDVEGDVMVIDAGYYDGTPAAHVDELHAVLESMTFE